MNYISETGYFDNKILKAVIPSSIDKIYGIRFPFEVQNLRLFVDNHPVFHSSNVKTLIFDEPIFLHSYFSLYLTCDISRVFISQRPAALVPSGDDTFCLLDNDISNYFSRLMRPILTVGILRHKEVPLSEIPNDYQLYSEVIKLKIKN